MPSITLEEAYSVLELTPSATEEEVKRAYKKLALRTHPDKNRDDPDANKKFLRISECYKRITDPDSFKDEDDGEGMPSEEELAAMFNMMFAEMMGFGGGGPGVDPFSGSAMGDFFDAMMMMDDDGDSEDYDDEDDEEGDIYNMGRGDSSLDDEMEMLAELMFGGGGGRVGGGRHQHHHASRANSNTHILHTQTHLNESNQSRSHQKKMNKKKQQHHQQQRKSAKQRKRGDSSDDDEDEGELFHAAMAHMAGMPGMGFDMDDMMAAFVMEEIMGAGGGSSNDRGRKGKAAGRKKGAASSSAGSSSSHSHTQRPYSSSSSSSSSSSHSGHPRSDNRGHTSSRPGPDKRTSMNAKSARSGQNEWDGGNRFSAATGKHGSGKAPVAAVEESDEDDDEVWETASSSGDSDDTGAYNNNDDDVGSRKENYSGENKKHAHAAAAKSNSAGDKIPAHKHTKEGHDNDDVQDDSDENSDADDEAMMEAIMYHMANQLGVDAADVIGDTTAVASQFSNRSKNHSFKSAGRGNAAAGTSTSSASGRSKAHPERAAPPGMGRFTDSMINFLEEEGDRRTAADAAAAAKRRKNSHSNSHTYRKNSDYATAAVGVRNQKPGGDSRGSCSNIDSSDSKQQQAHFTKSYSNKTDQSSKSDATATTSALKTAVGSSNSSEYEGVSIGHKVLVQGKYTGTVAFVGNVHYTKGTYAGVVMDKPHTGKNKGLIKGVEYFNCPGASKGLMVPINDVKIVEP